MKLNATEPVIISQRQRSVKILVCLLWLVGGLLGFIIGVQVQQRTAQRLFASLTERISSLSEQLGETKNQLSLSTLELERMKQDESARVAWAIGRESDWKFDSKRLKKAVKKRE